MPTLKEHAHQLLRAICLPPGFILAVDTITDNLVIHNGEYGFAITHHCLDDWPETRVYNDVRLAINAIVGGHDTSAALIQPVSSLLGYHPLLLEAVLRLQANVRGELLPADGPVKVRSLPTLWDSSEAIT